MWTPTKCTANNFTSLDAFEYDFKRGCSIVRAENRDDEGQESNGGGKSSFIDVFAVALLGQSLSDRSLKECVSWNTDQPYFIVTLSLEHPNHGELYIERKVYNNTRPAELIILLNGEVPKGVPTKGSQIDIIPGNKYLLEVIGISKADLLNYYLVSGAYYIPYMKAPAKQKTEIINRFSKADKIDEAIDIAASKAAEQKGVYEAHLEKKASIETALASLDNNLTEEQSTEELEKELEKIKPDMEQFDLSVSSLERNRDKIIARILKEIEQVKESEKSKFNDISSEAMALESSKGEDTQVYEAAIDQAKAAGKEKLGTAREVESYISEANKDLAGKVECPKCHHEFNAADPEKDLAEVKALKAESEAILSAVEKEIEENDQEISNLNVEKEALVKSYATQFDQLSKKKQEIRMESVSQVESYQDEIQSTRRDFEGDISADKKTLYELRSRSREIEIEIRSINAANKILFDYYERRKTLQAKLKECEKNIKEWSEDNRYTLWEGYFADFKFYLANKPIEAIVQAINFFLSKNESDLSVDIEGFIKLKSGEVRQKLNPIIYRNGANPQSYGSFSGGERARMDISCDLAFQEMINSASPTGGLNFYQNDELLNALDSIGIKNAATAFDQLDKPILLVTHSGADLHYENIVTIIKEKGKSIIQL